MIKVIEVQSRKTFWIAAEAFHPSLDFLRIDSSDYPNWRQI